MNSNKLPEKIQKKKKLRLSRYQICNKKLQLYRLNMKRINNSLNAVIVIYLLKIIN